MSSKGGFVLSYFPNFWILEFSSNTLASNFHMIKTPPSPFSQETKPTPSPLALLAATCSRIGPTSTPPTMASTPASASIATATQQIKGLPVQAAASATPQVVSVAGIPQQLLQQQQGTAAQVVAAAAAAGQNIAYNVMQPMQAVTVDGQEALFIPAMSLAAAGMYSRRWGRRFMKLR